VRRWEAEGESRPVPRSRIRKRRCRAWHDGESHANLDLRNGSSRVHLRARGKTANVVNVAIAREMVGFIWSIACTIQAAPKTR